MFIGSRGACSLFLLGALGACQHAAAPPNVASVALQPAAGQASVVPARAPVPSAGATPSATPPADPSPFVEGARLGYAAQLMVTGKTALLGTDKLLLAIRDDHVSIEPALLEGLHPERARFERVYGDLPNAAWAVKTVYEDRTSRSSLSRWTGSQWVAADNLVQGRNVLGISAWGDGRTLALTDNGYMNQVVFTQLGGPRTVPLPQLDRTARNAAGCVHGMQPMAMTATPSGEVFLVGLQCKAKSDEEIEFGDVAVERWGAGQTRGQISPLPQLAASDGVTAELDTVLAPSANDVFVAGSRSKQTVAGNDEESHAYLAHFDGQAWRAVSAPPKQRIDDLQRSPDGKLWALAGGELWASSGSVSDDIAWQHIAMPALASELGEHAVSTLWVRGNDDVWATLGAQGEQGLTYLVRTKHGAEPLSVPSDEQVANLNRAFDPMAVYDCAQPTLVLLTLARSAPLDADAPRVRAALRGHPEFESDAQLIEYLFLSRRYLGFRGELNTLNEISELISNAKIPGVTPELRCVSAEPVRTLAVDYGDKPAPPASTATANRKRASLDRF